MKPFVELFSSFLKLAEVLLCDVKRWYDYLTIAPGMRSTADVERYPIQATLKGLSLVCLSEHCRVTKSFCHVFWPTSGLKLIKFNRKFIIHNSALVLSGTEHLIAEAIRPWWSASFGESYDIFHFGFQNKSIFRHLIDLSHCSVCGLFLVIHMLLLNAVEFKSSSPAMSRFRIFVV